MINKPSQPSESWVRVFYLIGHAKIELSPLNTNVPMNLVSPNLKCSQNDTIFDTHWTTTSKAYHHLTVLWSTGLVRCHKSEFGLLWDGLEVTEFVQPKSQHSFWIPVIRDHCVRLGARDFN